MCQEKIESALKISGINSASWSPESQILEVDYDENRITLAAIRQKVASVGYDTDSLKAADSVYSLLHECCQYRGSKP